MPVIVQPEPEGTPAMTTDITALLGDDAESLLSHVCKTVPREDLHIPGPDFVERIFMPSDRPVNVLRNLQHLYDKGRLGGSGYLSILPVDQGVEHTAGASFGPNPMYFDPENIIKLGMEAGCNAVASTFGVLSMTARKYAHRIPYILKINHNELMTYPQKNAQILFAHVKQAFDMGAVAIGATCYFGSQDSNREIQYLTDAFRIAHEFGMVCILWSYTRNAAFKHEGTDYHTAADLTGQAVHLASTMGADIVKQKLPTNNGGFTALNYSKTHPAMYDKLCSDHPIDMCRYQVLNCYNGRAGLINSGGGSGANDLQDAVRTAVINKRAAGMGLILGRKAFQKPFSEGVELINAVQDVYLDDTITIA
jgi:class I fructose-bisphosphate aldolase